MDALFKALDTPASYDAGAARDPMRKIGEGAALVALSPRHPGPGRVERRRPASGFSLY
jgi:hypothetical protein